MEVEPFTRKFLKTKYSIFGIYASAEFMLCDSILTYINTDFHIFYEFFFFSRFSSDKSNKIVTCCLSALERSILKERINSLHQKYLRLKVVSTSQRFIYKDFLKSVHTVRSVAYNSFQVH